MRSYINKYKGKRGLEPIAKRIYAKHIKETPFIFNTDKGIKIHLDKKGLGKAVYPGSKPNQKATLKLDTLKVVVIEHLPTLLKEAKYIGSKNLNKIKDNNIEKYHYFKITIKIDGNNYVFQFDIEQRKGLKFQYSISRKF